MQKLAYSLIHHALIEVLFNLFCALLITISLWSNPRSRYINWILYLGSLLHITDLAAYIAACFTGDSQLRQLLLGLSTVFHPQYEIIRLRSVASQLSRTPYIYAQYSIWLIGLLQTGCAATPFFLPTLFPSILLLQSLDTVIFLFMSQWMSRQLSCERPESKTPIKMFRRDRAFCVVLALMGVSCAVFQFAVVQLDHLTAVMSMAMAFYSWQHCFVDVSSRGQELQSASSDNLV
ncbi:uncharacterized protein CIMG_08248 [Coccidioides immitis RS]|uniref:Uncharacterized protein n=1 Tax=Coccidioides immitis (strain RS) TaxID=246410 RepID=J3K540_COCIM|nr:uncharacterized protein CIMG_08248 [Coccidioides immitis RS]EAS29502.3 hypothetical protein CIMG_08248 [Coccidioides immitis RS]